MALILAVTALALSTATFSAAQNTTGGIRFQPCPELNALLATNGTNNTLFDCAQLSVPLDYTDPESGTLDLSLFRVNATVQPALGTVLINFGGPGATGAESLPGEAEGLRKNIGPEWNLLSWDPRGTGYTIPFNCSLGIGSSATTRKRALGNAFNLNITELFLNIGWQLAGQIADTCYTQSNETGTLIGTAFVARDMFEIVDALGEDGLLRYYGLSYGTALGSYAAAMFPDRIGAMVFDGNVNPHHYQAGHWLSWAEDTDEVFELFLQTCFNVTDDCALYSLVKPNTTQDLLDAINSVVLRPLAQNLTSTIDGFSYGTLKQLLRGSLYAPKEWPAAAEGMAKILNPTEVFKLPPPQFVYGAATDPRLGIGASDAIFHANSSDEYLPIVRAAADVSPGFSDTAYPFLWSSARWRLPAKERYWGNFRANTSRPILYVNGEFDPATPLKDAYNGSAGFAGSVVLPHNGYGHTSLASPSECVARYIQAYLRNGTLPETGARCEADLSPVELWRSVLNVPIQTSDGASRGNNGITLIFAVVLAVAVMIMV